MISYLKTGEVANYVTRATIPTGTEAAVIRAASSLIDAYCGRALGIKYYRLSFSLNELGVGYIPYRPVIGLAPKSFTTGFRIKPLRRWWSGATGTVGSWEDVSIPDDIEELIELSTGRVEIFSSRDGDFGRFEYNRHTGAQNFIHEWDAEIEVKAGYFVDTKLSVAALNNATQITVQDATGVVENETYLTKGDSIDQYLVTGKNGNVLTIASGLTSAGSVGDVVVQAVPEEIKIACANVIHDRLTYQPNTYRQQEKLSILTDEFLRMDRRPLPADARLLLKDYRN